MKKKVQIDNPVHPNKTAERNKALAALEKAKSIPRKVVFLPKGYSRDFTRKESSTEPIGGTSGNTGQVPPPNING